MKIVVTSVCSRSNGDETEITISVSSDGGEHSSRESFVLSVSQYIMLGITSGEADEELYDEVSRAAMVWDAAKRGTYILGYGAASRRSLMTKLVSKGYERSVAAEAVELIVSLGLIRERDDALRAAQMMRSKLWGRRRIVSGLYEKGYDAETVAAVMNELEDMGVDFSDGCAELIEKRYLHLLENSEGRKRLFAALSRYGYSTSEIKDAIGALLNDGK